MLSRGSVAIDLGTVNTLVWVDGRGLVLEEPSAIAIDDAVGSVAAIGTAAEALSDKEPKGIRVLHPLRDGVIDDLDATAEMLHGFLRQSGVLGGPFKRRAVVCVPGGATWVERRSVVAAFGTRRSRCVVELVDEPVESSIAMADGSSSTRPRPSTQTSVLTVPRSMATPALLSILGHLSSALGAHAPACGVTTLGPRKPASW